MNVDRAIDDVLDAERDLAGDLRRVGERHAVDSGVYHVAETLAARCADQAALLEPHLERYGAGGAPPGDDGSDALERMRSMASQVLGKTAVSGMLLLRDLQGLYLSSHRAELAWVVLVQVAKATRDGELLAAAERGRVEAERRWKWVRTRVKEASPQVLVAG